VGRLLEEDLANLIDSEIFKHGLFDLQDSRS